MKNKVLKCIKKYAEDIKNYGIDFKKGKEYIIQSKDNNGIYVLSENGTSVLFENENELKIYFEF